MHSSRMRTVHSSSHQLGGGLPQYMLGYTPRCRPGDPHVWAWRPHRPDP